MASNSAASGTFKLEFRIAEDICCTDLLAREKVSYTTFLETEYHLTFPRKLQLYIPSCVSLLLHMTMKKTYVQAGELGLEIYSLSLSSVGYVRIQFFSPAGIDLRSMDDDQLSISVSRIPPGGILLIEDIDCAFPSREDDEDDNDPPQFRSPRFPRSQITLSGLLNMIDGIGSGTLDSVIATHSIIYVDSRGRQVILRHGDLLFHMITKYI